jgi:membrane protease YdiL (CAAX protease family)
MALATGVFLLIIGCTLGGLYLVRLVFGLERAEARPLALLATGLTEMALVLVAWIFGPARRGGGWRALGFRGFSPLAAPSAILAVLVAGFSVTIAYGLLLRGLGLSRLGPEPVRSVIGDQSSAVLLAAFLAALVAPVAEETFFRGFLLGGLRQRFGSLPALLISAAAFAVFHGDPRVFIPIFFLGLLLGTVFLTTRSLFPSIFAHGVYNLTVLLIAYRVTAS